ncbi:hypothetical protein HMPREF9413_3210 [Paenibacillus sp. HGF7]|nr:MULTISPECIES: hypothetical protein [Paenibacillus]EGL18926.1 hypothetical protein HMPREF9413_3210 [Paenibacillus sp. HGF7]EPD92199.1 hypothetical protein HMPREF1207_00865 [Paenibacillus sp. HGH0039]MBV6712788.1 hypothetical protein [Paenibacillus chitinolyticus]
MMPHPRIPDPGRNTSGRLSQMLQPSYMLCRDDVVWALEFIRKKMAEQDPRLKELTQPRLLKNFESFAEVSMMLVHRRSAFDQEADRIKSCLKEASYGLFENEPLSERDSSPAND